MRVIDNTVFLAGDNWDEWASAAYFCIELPELLHQGHSSVQDSHTQHVCRHSTRYEKCSHAHYICILNWNDWLSFSSCSGWVQDCRHGTHQILPGTQDWWRILLNPSRRLKAVVWDFILHIRNCLDRCFGKMNFTTQCLLWFPVQWIHNSVT